MKAFDLAAIEAASRAMVLPEDEAWGILGPLVNNAPAGWRVARTGEDGAQLLHKDGRSVIVSVSRKGDGKRWLHVSVARRDRLPSYDDLCDLHRTFVGADRTALQVFVPASQHVNIHPNCLHLWSCLDGDVVPDFTLGTGSV